MNSETAVIAARVSTAPHENASNHKRQTKLCGALYLALHRITFSPPSPFRFLSRLNTHARTLPDVSL
jgi:hypothetical protein